MKFENVSPKMSSTKLKQTKSEENNLQAKGYKLLRLLGQGGYAKVYLGEFKSAHSDQPAQLACKVIDAKRSPTRFLTKFLPRELKILIKVSHPHIIQVHSIFQRKSKYYIFMRYAEKGDLYEYIKDFGAIKQDKARIWLRQIALAVQYLHTLEIAHRDLKCENILITIHNNVKISDFGFARHILSADFRRELSETYCGSITYVPPEILRGEPYNPKIADLWSLGVMLYTMVNGVYPFESKNVKLLYEYQINKKWKFRSKLIDLFSEELKTLITGLLEPDITRRYKIEQVINSAWIAMDSRLKSLSTTEFAALSAAMAQAKSAGLSSEPYEGPRNRILSSTLRCSKENKNSVTFYLEHDGGFDLHLIRSDLAKVQAQIV